MAVGMRSRPSSTINSKKPHQPLAPQLNEIVKFVLSKNGQELTEKGGYYSITNDSREADLQKLRIAAP